MNFSHALEHIKRGTLMTRKGLAKMSYVVAMPGYPDMIPINSATAKAIHRSEGTRLKFNPYLAIMNTDLSMNPWNPTNDDILANDWIEHEQPD